MRAGLEQTGAMAQWQPVAAPSRTTFKSKEIEDRSHRPNEQTG